MTKSILIVGAGLYGAVCARELTDNGLKVRVIEKRGHIGGNCYTRPLEDCGGHEHVYGPHIFHTDSIDIWNYLSRYTKWLPYTHRPKARIDGVLYSLPFNLMTLQQVYGVSTPDEGRRKLDEVRVPHPDPTNLEEWCLNSVGPELYNLFIRGYTSKQWQRHPRQLPASIIQRLPVRLNFDDNYFNHRFQGIPSEGYTKIFERLLAEIHVDLNIDFLDDRDYWFRKYDHVMFTGTIDSFFEYSEGALEYLSMRFDSLTYDCHDFQGVSQINETSADVPYTRVVEHKHFYLDLSKPRTLVTYEYPIKWKPGITEYYPVDTIENRLRHQGYLKLLGKIGLSMTVGGRLGEYRYYDMHQAIAAALSKSKELISNWR